MKQNLTVCFTQFALQYEEGSLESALFLLSPLTADDCRCVATVTRCLIDRVNDSDGTGDDAHHVIY